MIILLSLTQGVNNPVKYIELLDSWGQELTNTHIYIHKGYLPFTPWLGAVGISNLNEQVGVLSTNPQVLRGWGNIEDKVLIHFEIMEFCCFAWLGLYILAGMSISRLGRAQWRKAWELLPGDGNLSGKPKRLCPKLWGALFQCLLWIQVWVVVWREFSRGVFGSELNGYPLLWRVLPQSLAHGIAAHYKQHKRI